MAGAEVPGWEEQEADGAGERWGWWSGCVGGDGGVGARVVRW